MGYSKYGRRKDKYRCYNIKKMKKGKIYYQISFKILFSK